MIVQNFINPPFGEPNRLKPMSSRTPLEINNNSEQTFAEQRNPDPAVNMYQSPYLFNGKELDEETSLYYYGARYMQPILSMWMSVDPLSDAKPNYNPSGQNADKRETQYKRNKR